MIEVGSVSFEEGLLVGLSALPTHTTHTHIRTSLSKLLGEGAALPFVELSQSLDSSCIRVDGGTAVADGPKLTAVLRFQACEQQEALLMKCGSAPDGQLNVTIEVDTPSDDTDMFATPIKAQICAPI